MRVFTTTEEELGFREEEAEDDTGKGGAGGGAEQHGPTLRDIPLGVAVGSALYFCVASSGRECEAQLVLDDDDYAAGAGDGVFLTQ